MIMWAGNERLTTAPFVRSLPSGHRSSIVTSVRSAALAAEPSAALRAGRSACSTTPLGTYECPPFPLVACRITASCVA